MRLRERFKQMSNTDLRYWLAQYAGDQAGYYPGLRRMRAAAEAEARRRGIVRESVTPYRLELLRLRAGCRRRAAQAGGAS